MSFPHTGKLKAIVRRAPCDFDGERWTTPDPQLTELLNAAAEMVPKQHFTIDQIATRAVKLADLENGFQILSTATDPGQIPPDAID